MAGGIWRDQKQDAFLIDGHWAQFAPGSDGHDNGTCEGRLPWVAFKCHSRSGKQASSVACSHSVAFYSSFPPSFSSQAHLFIPSWSLHTGSVIYTILVSSHRHYWPEDPSVAEPTKLSKKGLEQQAGQQAGGSASTQAGPSRAGGKKGGKGKGKGRWCFVWAVLRLGWPQSLQGSFEQFALAAFFWQTIVWCNERVSRVRGSVHWPGPPGAWTSSQNKQAEEGLGWKEGRILSGTPFIQTLFLWAVMALIVLDLFLGGDRAECQICRTMILILSAESCELW